MSYISATTSPFLADSLLTHALATPSASHVSLPEPPVPASARLSTGLEVTLALATLSGLSLTFCTIAAGVF